MEKYVGIKFKNISIDNKLPKIYDNCNRQIYNVYKILHKIGFVDLYEGGASGNISIKIDDEFIITKSGYNPIEEFDSKNFNLIIEIDKDRRTVKSCGANNPSSEAILHDEIYKNIPYTKSIIHWHSDLMSNFIVQLRIEETKTFYEYGTIELANSAVELLQESKRDIIYLKNHGFVSIATNLRDNFNQVINLYKNMLDFLNPL